MYYSININQIAIATYNKAEEAIKLDLIDGCIMEYLQKQSTSGFAKKNFIIKDDEVYFLICYENIIKQLPLLNIETKDAIGRRIKKLKEGRIINHFVDRKNNNKVYFNTTDLFETFFSYDLTDEKPNPFGFQNGRLTDEKPNHNIYDKNIKDNSINDKEKYKKENLNELIDNDFESLWSLYGKIGNKAQAKKSFLKAIKSVSIDDLTQSIQRYLNYLESIKKPNFYPIKHFSTWLNNEGWLDEYNVQIQNNPTKPVDYNFSGKNFLDSITEDNI